MEEIIKKITGKWNLPTVYLDYLNKHPKRGKLVDDDRFVNGLELYAASQLIKKQEGYSYNPIEKKPIDDWPQDCVVIADDGADPYVLDLSQSDGEDAPVLFACHGQGDWDFEEYASSCTEFLESLDVK
jgi:hypothetical protein